MCSYNTDKFYLVNSGILGLKYLLGEFFYKICYKHLVYLIKHTIFAMCLRNTDNKQVKQIDYESNICKGHKGNG